MERNSLHSRLKGVVHEFLWKVLQRRKTPLMKDEFYLILVLGFYAFLLAHSGYYQGLVELKNGNPASVVWTLIFLAQTVVARTMIETTWQYMLENRV